MEEIDHLGIVGGHPMGACLARLAEEDDYYVHRIGFAADEEQIGKLQEMPNRVKALCICASGPPAMFRAVAEHLRLGREHRPTYVFNMTPVGPGHARCIDALLRRLDPTTTFAETAFLGGAGAVENRVATVIYGSRAGPPSESVERFLLGFAAQVIGCQNVTEATAAKLVNEVASLLTGLATHEAVAIGERCGISTERISKILSSTVANNDLSPPFAAPASEQVSKQRRIPEKEMRLLLSNAVERGLRDGYIRLLAESREGSEAWPW